MSRNDNQTLIEIPEDLSPETEKLFRATLKENSILKGQVKQIKKTLRRPFLGTKGSSNKETNSNTTKNPHENVIARRSPIKDIRLFCIKCVGGEENGRKPLKAVRECNVKNCSLHPYRMGKNPFQKHRLSEEDRKSLALTAQERFRKKE